MYVKRLDGRRMGAIKEKRQVMKKDACCNCRKSWLSFKGPPAEAIIGNGIRVSEGWGPASELH